MSSTSPPADQAKFSVIYNDDNNSDNLSASAHDNVTFGNVEQLSSRDTQFLTNEQHFSNKEYYDYFNETFTNLLIQQKAISDSNAVLRKLLDEESKTHRVRLQNIIDQMKKELQRRAIESAKLTHKIQEERLRTDKLVKKKCNEMFVLRMERENEITNIFKKCLNVNASDKQDDANENVASHLLTSHPSTANVPQNDNTVADSPISTPRISNNYVSIVVNKTIKEPKKNKSIKRPNSKKKLARQSPCLNSTDNEKTVIEKPNESDKSEFESFGSD